MKIFLLISSFFTCALVFAQRHTSSCDTAGNLLYFGRDMDQILLYNMKYTDTAAYNNTVEIPKDSFMFYLQRLSTLRNMKGIKALDTIFGVLGLHTIEKVYMRKMEVVANESLSWVTKLKNNVQPTGHALIDQYMSDYDMTYEYRSFGGGVAGMYFFTGMNVNMHALANKFRAIDNCIANAHPLAIGDGSYIRIVRINDSTSKAWMEYGFDDCPAYCIHRVKWEFNIYNDCTFEYVGVSGNVDEFRKLKMNILNQDYQPICVYPNPFTNSLNFDHSVEGFNYEIVGVDGRILLSGGFNENASISTGQLPAGVYMIKLSSENHTYTRMLIRE